VTVTEDKMKVGMQRYSCQSAFLLVWLLFPNCCHRSFCI